MRFALAILVSVAAYGQSQRPPGFVRGTLTTASPYAFSIRATTGVLYQYRTDTKTWIERDNERIRASGLRPGEILEVVSDRDPDPVRYARMVHVIARAVPVHLPVSAGGVYRLNPAAPLPVVIFTGLVVNRDRQRISLRTRFDGEKTIYFRDDTQCLNGGDQVDSDSLLASTRVYVVAVQNSDQQLEAYQVVWGAILEPEPR
jgi:Domain of unknown function (DUF5666)